MRVCMMVVAGALMLATPVWAQQGDGFVRFRAMDANTDGVVSHAEAEAMRTAQFNRLDTNGDGYLSQAERNVVPRVGRRLRHVSDADNDGRLSRSELMAAPYRGFNRLDANHDGAISAAEVEAARARAR